MVLVDADMTKRTRGTTCSGKESGKRAEDLRVAGH